MLAVTFVLSHFLAVMALVLAAVGMFAPLLGESEHLFTFVISAGLIGYVAVSLILAIRGKERRLRRVERFALALALWLVLPLFAMLPTLLVLDNVTPAEAYFEAVSALTTTGASVLPPPEQQPRILVLWHATLQWFGGALTLLVVTTILAYAGLGGLPDTQARLIEHGGEDEWRRVVRTLGEVLPVYIGLSLLVFLAMALSGVPAFEAWCLGGAAIATAGLLPFSGDVSAHLTPAATWVMSVGMLLGATSILWQRALVTGRRRQILDHRESYWFAGGIIVLAVIIAALLFQAAGSGAGRSLREGVFAAASLMSTTGIELRPGVYDVLAPSVIAVILLVGGCSFSTAGGVKLFRVAVMLGQTTRDVAQLVYPRSVSRPTMSGFAFDADVLRAVWSHFALVIVFVGSIAVFLSAYGFSLDSAFSGAIAIAANAGPVFSALEQADGGQFSVLTTPGQLAIAFAMAVARIEVILLLSVLGFQSWRR
ncbi:MAG: potassium transporter TrkG [Pseudomonadota bacterium]